MSTRSHIASSPSVWAMSQSPAPATNNKIRVHFRIASEVAAHAASAGPSSPSSSQNNSRKSAVLCKPTARFEKIARAWCQSTKTSDAGTQLDFERQTFSVAVPGGSASGLGIDGSRPSVPVLVISRLDYGLPLATILRDKLGLAQLLMAVETEVEKEVVIHVRPNKKFEIRVRQDVFWDLMEDNRRQEARAAALVGAGTAPSTEPSSSSTSAAVAAGPGAVVGGMGGSSSSFSCSAPTTTRPRSLRALAQIAPPKSTSAQIYESDGSYEERMRDCLESFFPGFEFNADCTSFNDDGALVAQLHDGELLQDSRASSTFAALLERHFLSKFCSLYRGYWTFEAKICKSERTVDENGRDTGTVVEGTKRVLGKATGIQVSAAMEGSRTSLVEQDTSPTSNTAPPSASSSIAKAAAAERRSAFFFRRYALDENWPDFDSWDEANGETLVILCSHRLTRPGVYDQRMRKFIGNVNLPAYQRVGEMQRMLAEKTGETYENAAFYLDRGFQLDGASPAVSGAPISAGALTRASAVDYGRLEMLATDETVGTYLFGRGGGRQLQKSHLPSSSATAGASEASRELLAQVDFRPTALLRIVQPKELVKLKFHAHGFGFEATSATSPPPASLGGQRASNAGTKTQKFSIFDTFSLRYMLSRWVDRRAVGDERHLKICDSPKREPARNVVKQEPDQEATRQRDGDDRDAFVERDSTAADAGDPRERALEKLCLLWDRNPSPAVDYEAPRPEAAAGVNLNVKMKPPSRTLFRRVRLDDTFWRLWGAFGTKHTKREQVNPERGDGKMICVETVRVFPSEENCKAWLDRVSPPAPGKASLGAERNVSGSSSSSAPGPASGRSGNGPPAANKKNRILQSNDSAYEEQIDDFFAEEIRKNPRRKSSDGATSWACFLDGGASPDGAVGANTAAKERRKKSPRLPPAPEPLDPREVLRQQHRVIESENRRNRHMERMRARSEMLNPPDTSDDENQEESAPGGGSGAAPSSLGRLAGAAAGANAGAGALQNQHVQEQGDENMEDAPAAAGAGDYKLDHDHRPLSMNKRESLPEPDCEPPRPRTQSVISPQSALAAAPAAAGASDEVLVPAQVAPRPAPSPRLPAPDETRGKSPSEGGESSSAALLDSIRHEAVRRPKRRVVEIAGVAVAAARDIPTRPGYSELLDVDATSSSDEFADSGDDFSPGRVRGSKKRKSSSMTSKTKGRKAGGLRRGNNGCARNGSTGSKKNTKQNLLKSSEQRGQRVESVSELDGKNAPGAPSSSRRSAARVPAPARLPPCGALNGEDFFDGGEELEKNHDDDEMLLREMTRDLEKLQDGGASSFAFAGASEGGLSQSQSRPGDTSGRNRRSRRRNQHRVVDVETGEVKDAAEFQGEVMDEEEYLQLVLAMSASMADAEKEKRKDQPPPPEPEP